MYFLLKIKPPVNVKFSKRFVLNLQGLFFISACGKQNGKDENTGLLYGFSPDYVAPSPTIVAPEKQDSYFKILEPVEKYPYWVSALEMDPTFSDLPDLLENYQKQFTFGFPDAVPSYAVFILNGWITANDEMKVASRNIFNQLDEVLDVHFVETTHYDEYNVIVIGQSVQETTAGFSYFPNASYLVGSDVFLSTYYSSPSYIDSDFGRTNIDFEVLIHEIGHALGLKHPFETDMSNLYILDDHEDNTMFTAMSYDNNELTYDGSFRALDWMALTKLYGVNPNYKAEDNIYEFSSVEGVFILDGGGDDTIDAHRSLEDIYLDLRPGQHNFKGSKSSFITDPNQLTISHGSGIENSITGIGNDIITGNDLNNIINTQSGDDVIFPAEGSDIVNSGSGNDTIDLSENIPEKDTLIISHLDFGSGLDVVYGFDQGASGDVLDFGLLISEETSFLPLVGLNNVPAGIINNSVLRIYGENIESEKGLKMAFEENNVLSALKISQHSSSVLISAESQDLGEVQNLFIISADNSEIKITQVMRFIGDNLDIDLWTAYNLNIFEGHVIA